MSNITLRMFCFCTVCCMLLIWNLNVWPKWSCSLLCPFIAADIAICWGCDARAIWWGTCDGNRCICHWKHLKIIRWFQRWDSRNWLVGVLFRHIWEQWIDPRCSCMSLSSLAVYSEARGTEAHSAIWVCVKGLVWAMEKMSCEVWP